MSNSTPKSYSTDPILYIYASLTSGSSHIVTATSRLETILKANKIPFKAIDVATDEKARMLWGRRAGKDESGRQRKFPGLVQMGLVVGDLVEIEEWNEYGELKDHIKIVPIEESPAPSAIPTPSGTPSKPPRSEPKSEEKNMAESAPGKAGPSVEATKESNKPPAGAVPTSFTLAMRQVGEEAAQKAKDAKKKATDVLIGKGQAEPPKEQEGTKLTPAPIIINKEIPTGDGVAETIIPMQSPTSTAWKSPSSTSQEADRPSRFGGAFSSSMQSPNSTAWKPTDIGPPILTHRGSSISVASAEEIKEVERSQTIDEEDEEEEDDDDDDDDDSEEGEEEEDDEVEDEGKGKGDKEGKKAAITV